MARDREAFGASEERKLELRLAPPGDWVVEETINSRENDDSPLSLGYFSKPVKNTTTAGAKRGFSSAECGDSDENQSQKLPSNVFFPSPWSSSSKNHSPLPRTPQQSPAIFQFQTKLPTLVHDSVQRNGAKVEPRNHEQKPSSPPEAASRPSQTRGTTAPVVGWPPIRSFRKNIASSSSKPASESPKTVERLPEEPVKKGLFVKINMDGVPIGRKVDLQAHDSYGKLSSAVDELFSGLLAAQRDCSVAGTRSDTKEKIVIEGLLDGSGEYTLVYEDNEGDRMLVGDVPWEMFVSTVKRLRVLKSSELSTLRVGSSKQDKLSPACGGS